MRRKRSNWKITAAVSCFLVAAVCAAVWAMDAAVTRMLRELSAEAVAGMQPPAGEASAGGTGSSGEQASGAGAAASDGGMELAEGAEEFPPAQPSSEPVSPAPSPADRQAESGNASSSGTESSGASPPPTAPPKKTSPSSDRLEYQANVSPERAEEVQERVTLAEKAEIASVFMKRFSMAELKAFAEIAKDGITVEEKRELRGLFIDRLSEEEYNRLIAIAAKYGLSAGKTYDQIAAEEKKEEAE